MTPLPAVFDEVLEQPGNRFLDEARERGDAIVAYLCSFVPLPLLQVEGLSAWRARVPGVAGTPLADTYLSSVICPYIRGVLECVMDGAAGFVDGWLHSASCDHQRRLFDNLDYLERPPLNLILDLPHKRTDAAVAWYAEELERVAATLAEHFGVDTGPDALRTAIRRRNEVTRLLRDLAAERSRPEPTLSGADLHRVLVALSALPLDAAHDLLGELLAGLEGAEPIRRPRARLLFVGSQLDDPRRMEVIESQGGQVVVDRTCTGTLPDLPPIPEQGEPLPTLARHMLEETACPRMMEDFEDRLRRIVDAARAHQADGVILSTLKFCDCWGVEASLLVPALREEGLPVLRLEREYASTGEGQLRTRVQAFLESMRR